ncbi:MAG TPA: hypothetical protein VJ757_00280, partial [Pseudonocardiaceae bacterium]|nr:hypothetical protein [Pseudonocardiaceae bacterium]
DGGELMFSSDAASSTEDSSFRQYWSLTDAQGNIIVSDDAYTGLGLALPWIPIVMYPKFTTTAVKYGYLTIDNGQIHTESTVWEGRIPLVIQPYLTVDGTWGIGSGSSTAPTYKLKIGGTTVDTWSESGLGAYQRGPIDIRPWFGWHFAKIEITVVVPTGSGAQIAAQVLGCTMRQS